MTWLFLKFSNNFQNVVVPVCAFASEEVKDGGQVIGSSTAQNEALMPKFRPLFVSYLIQIYFIFLSLIREMETN